MCQLSEAKREQEAAAWMMDECSDLFREWLVDLTAEEKEVWFWNASVEMLRIKRRRGIAGS